MLLKAAYAGKSILFLYNAIIEDAPASNVIKFSMEPVWNLLSGLQHCAQTASRPWVRIALFFITVTQKGTS